MVTSAYHHVGLTTHYQSILYYDLVNIKHQDARTAVKNAFIGRSEQENGHRSDAVKQAGNGCRLFDRGHVMRPPEVLYR